MRLATMSSIGPVTKMMRSFKQTRIDVVGALAAGGLFDHHRHKRVHVEIALSRLIRFASPGLPNSKLAFLMGRQLRDQGLTQRPDADIRSADPRARRLFLPSFRLRFFAPFSAFALVLLAFALVSVFGLGLFRRLRHLRTARASARFQLFGRLIGIEEEYLAVDLLVLDLHQLRPGNRSPCPRTAERGFQPSPADCSL
mgnify:CR=1 FL=1